MILVIIMITKMLTEVTLIGIQNMIPEEIFI